MKKFVSLLLALSLAAVMTACAGGAPSSESTADESSSTASESSSSETAADETPAEEAAEEEAPAEEAAVMSYDEYAAAAVDDAVTIQAYVQAKQVLSTNDQGQTVTSLYLQDADGAYFAYGVQCSEEDYEKLTEGVCVQVSGYKAEWSGEVEIMEGTFTFVEGADTFVAEPVDVTELLGTDELESHQNQKVKFTGLTVAASEIEGDETEYPFLYNWDGSGTEGDDLYFTVAYNGAEYSFVVESDLCDSSTDVYKAVEALEIGQTVDCEGFLYWYEGANPHITSVTVAG